MGGGLVNGDFANRTIRAADAKEVGVGNPAEETCRHPNQISNRKIAHGMRKVNTRIQEVDVARVLA